MIELRMTKPKPTDKQIADMINFFYTLGSDVEEINRRIEILISLYRSDMLRNNPDYADLPDPIDNAVVLNYISPTMLAYYCYNLARMYFIDNKEYKDGIGIEMVRNNDFNNYRYNFITMYSWRKKKFKDYLAKNNMTVKDYWTQYFATCLAQQYSIYAATVADHVPFPSRSSKPLEWVQHWNDMLYMANEIVTHDNCYTPV